MPTPASSLRIAIVVPALDEESTLAETLANALEQADEVVLSDGGSRDRTLAIAKQLEVPVVTGPPGRGRQLNRGAEGLQSDGLLFVHADVRIPPNAVELVRQALAGGAVGGGFFVRWRSERALLRFGGRLTNLRTRLTRCPLGDQAQFCRTDVFRELGGFPEWPILEDVDFAQRLKKRGRVALLEPPVEPSVRRYAQGGAVRTVVINWIIWILFFVGVAPERLARLYKEAR